LIILIEQENKSLEGKRYGEEEWTIVQKPKEKVGLGVINLRLQNDALLLNSNNITSSILSGMYLGLI